MKSIKSGSAQGGANANSLALFPVNLPPLSEQKSIASILSSLDNKIDNLQKQNETLEQIAQTLFRQWFVEFEFPYDFAQGKPSGDGKPYKSSGGKMVESELGEIPEGWKTISIFHSGQFINGGAFKLEDFEKEGLPVIKIIELKNGITEQTKYTKKIKHEKYLIDNENILFSWSGSPDTSIDIFLWSDGKAILNQHTFKVLEKTPEEKSWLFFQLKELKPFFIHLAKQKQTTGLGHVTITDLKENFICKPPEDILLEYNMIADNIFNKLFLNKKEIQNLSKLRDTLLPKLMSGEIRLK